MDIHEAAAGLEAEFVEGYRDGRNPDNPKPSGKPQQRLPALIRGRAGRTGEQTNLSRHLSDARR